MREEAKLTFRTEMGGCRYHEPPEAVTGNREGTKERVGYEYETGKRVH
ncbi:MAG: hypothetical protein HFI11_12385 [Lachnospiraceae bacterium]|nr:hypothetical protein [Lachnospiraceae bacterium]